ncbi:MAG: alpha-glucan family phosphorylase [bacterium]
MNILPKQPEPVKVAYFSMEIMLENDIATYAGGLGMLAGDILRSLCDKSIPAVGITIAFNNGYTNQIINNDGTQQFMPAEWIKNDQLSMMSETVTIIIEGRELTIACYRYDIVSPKGFIVPVLLLTTDYYTNSDDQKYFTKYLYDHDQRIRLIQEAILGIGGTKILRKLGYDNIENFHMNDGHCAFLTLETLKENNYDIQKTKNQCCFTTHTPVPAGRDRFDYDMVYKVLGEYLPLNIRELAGNDKLDMPQLAWSLSKYVNGVSKKHGVVSTDMFKDEIDYITNGVHLFTWASPVTQEIFDKYLPEWRSDINQLNNIDSVPDDVLLQMQQINKKNLVEYVNKYLDHKHDHGSRFDTNALTISFGRRCVAYKRPDLIFYDLKRLLRLGIGKIQIIYSGKTHPDDGEAADILKRIIEYRNKFSEIISIVYIENYCPSVAKFLYSGSDVWLNNPVVPMEASGTSGMKAALNGTINLSMMDGWFIEGVEMQPESSFIIGEQPSELYPTRNDAKDSDDLYKVLEDQVIPMFYENKSEWLKKVRASIKLATYFNTNRVVDEYMKKAWKN